MVEYRIKSAVFSAMNLFFGFVIYIFLRSGTYIHELLPQNMQLFFLEVSSQTEVNYLTEFLKYYFVDYLWGASLAFALCSVISVPNKIRIIAVAFVSFFLGVLFEISQHFSVVDGTFDLIDICMYAAASFVCAVININIFLRRKT